MIKKGPRSTVLNFERGEAGFHVSNLTEPGF